MTVYHETISLQTDPHPEFYDVTHQVKEIVARSKVRDGIVVVFSPHTTCSVIIQEDSLDTTYKGTKFIFRDLLDIFDRIVPECKKEGQYLHPGPKCADFSVNVVGEPLPYTLNTDAHLRSSIIGRSESIPILGGEVVLGEFGNIYFADFDGTRPRERTVHVQVVGE